MVETGQETVWFRGSLVTSPVGVEFEVQQSDRKMENKIRLLRFRDPSNNIEYADERANVQVSASPQLHDPPVRGVGGGPVIVHGTYIEFVLKLAPVDRQRLLQIR